MSASRRTNPRRPTGGWTDRAGTAMTEERGDGVTTYRIGVIAGDGTGPEVVREGRKVLDAVAAAEGFSFDGVEYDLGGDRYLRTGETLPDSALDEFRGLDALYLGAVGDPRVPPGVLERDLLLRIRFELDQYVNLRPVRPYPGVSVPLAGVDPSEIDMVFVRENSEGLYAGAGEFRHKGTGEEVAVQESVNTRRGVDRCLRFAFGLARAEGRRDTSRWSTRRTSSTT